MLTVTEPLSNQADVVLVSHGITPSTLAISHMETLPYLKLCFIRVTATSMLSAHNFGVVIRIVLQLLSLLFFSISPSHINNATIVLDGEDLDEKEMDSTVPTIRGTQHNDHDSSEEEVEWFSPPPPPSALSLPPSLPMIPSPITSFKLGTSLIFYNGMGQAETVV
jgi:hypothetical protein